MSETIRVLTQQEMKVVNGGLLPVLAAIGSFAAHSGVRSVGGFLFSRAMTTYGVYSAAASRKDQ